MRTEQNWLADARMAAAVNELRTLVSSHYPTATYELAAGDDPNGLYLTATVDLDDPDEVVDLVVDRLLGLQVEDGLPLYVIPIRTPERRAALARPTTQLRGKTAAARRPTHTAAVPHRTGR